MKIEAILDSYANGQRKQMIDQIKRYGVRQFFVDLAESFEADVVTKQTFIEITLIYMRHKP